MADLCQLVGRYVGKGERILDGGMREGGSGESSFLYRDLLKFVDYYSISRNLSQGDKKRFRKRY